MTTAPEPLTADLLESVAVLYRNVFNCPPWNDEWSVESATERPHDVFETPGFSGVVMLGKGREAIGFAADYRERWWDGRHFYLAEMAVLPRKQREGIGGILLDALRGSPDGVDHVYLLTGPDSPASRFYEKHRFRATRGRHVMSRRR